MIFFRIESFEDIVFTIFFRSFLLFHFLYFLRSFFFFLLQTNFFLFWSLNGCSQMVTKIFLSKLTFLKKIFVKCFLINLEKFHISYDSLRLNFFISRSHFLSNGQFNYGIFFKLCLCFGKCV